MSLILEALRKSEAERRRGQPPDLFADLPPASRRTARRSPPWWQWLPFVAATLAVSGRAVRGLLGDRPSVAPPVVAEPVVDAARPVPQAASSSTQFHPEAAVATAPSRPVPIARAPAPVSIHTPGQDQPPTPPASVAPTLS